MKELLERAKSKACLAEIAKYCVFGLATTIVNLVVYQLLLRFLDYRISNLIAILTAKLFAYVSNKLFVFHSRCSTKKELLFEMLRFILARGATGLIDYFGLIAAVDLFHFDRVWSKYGIQIIVIVLNYLLGKRAVFLNGSKEE